MVYKKIISPLEYNEEGLLISTDGMEMSGKAGVVWPANVYDLNGCLVKARARQSGRLGKGRLCGAGQENHEIVPPQKPVLLIRKRLSGWQPSIFSERKFSLQ